MIHENYTRYTAVDEEGKTICSCCGARVVEYTHKLSKGIVIGLYRLYQRNEVTHIKKLDLSYNQRSNFQKLKYWDLVRHAESKRNGYYEITERGKMFIEGATHVDSHVRTYRGVKIEYTGEPVFISDYISVIEDYQTREDYAETAQPHYDY